MSLNNNGVGFKTYVAKQKRANATKDEDFYADKFVYDRKNDQYICPAGQILSPSRYRKSKEKEIIGHNYHNYSACKNCEIKDQCTKSKRGRIIYRSVDQNLLDEVD